MKSELNALLRRYDDLIVKRGKEPPTMVNGVELICILGSLARLLDDEELEINRDLFDGVSNETRRHVILGFSSMISEGLKRSMLTTGQVTLALVGTDPTLN